MILCCALCVCACVLVTSSGINGYSDVDGAAVGLAWNVAT